MDPSVESLQRRIEHLERRLARRPLAVAAIAVVGLAAFQGGPSKAAETLRVTRLVVVDDAGRDRIVLGQDPVETQRMSRAVGLTLHDADGAERGGFGVMEDGSVVLGLDAPAGVGSPMRDRIGLKVHANGAAAVSLIDNETKIPVRLISEADGSGGVEFLDYDLAARKALIRRVHFSGESRRDVPLDPPK